MECRLAYSTNPSPVENQYTPDWRKHKSLAFSITPLYYTKIQKKMQVPAVDNLWKFHAISVINGVQYNPWLVNQCNQQWLQ